MIHHDLAHWPLALTVVRGPMTRAEHTGFLAEWNRWLDCGERFATLRMFVDGDALVHPEGAARDAKQWPQANAARIRAQVLGMATVVPAEELDRMSRMNATKLFGVPAEAFGDTRSALDFLAWRIAPPDGVAWDRAEISTRLRHLLKENRVV